MASKIVTVNVKVEAGTMVSLKAKENLLLAISELPQEFQELLFELSKNRQALKGILENKEMLLSMLPK